LLNAENDAAPGLHDIMDTMPRETQDNQLLANLQDEVERRSKAMMAEADRQYMRGMEMIAQREADRAARRQQFLEHAARVIIRGPPEDAPWYEWEQKDVEMQIAAFAAYLITEEGRVEGRLRDPLQIDKVAKDLASRIPFSKRHIYCTLKYVAQYAESAFLRGS
jgi:hypothetical protein